MWLILMTSLVGLQLIVHSSTTGGWPVQTLRKLGVGTTLQAAFAYSRLPDDCLLADDGVSGAPNVDIIIDVSPIGGCTHRKSVVMIRQLVTPEDGPMFICNIGSDVALIDLCTIATYNLMLRQQGTGGTVCGSKGDLGSMYALGTRVLPDCVNTYEYAANSRLQRDLL